MMRSRDDAMIELKRFMGSENVEVHDVDFDDEHGAIMAKERSGDLTFWDNPNSIATILYTK